VDECRDELGSGIEGESEAEEAKPIIPARRTLMI
jgi:hypothetical protein